MLGEVLCETCERMHDNISSHVINSRLMSDSPCKPFDIVHVSSCPTSPCIALPRRTVVSGFAVILWISIKCRLRPGVPLRSRCAPPLQACLLQRPSPDPSFALKKRLQVSIVSQISWVALFGHVPIFIPLLTRPKIVCFPSSQGVGASVMKN